MIRRKVTSGALGVVAGAGLLWAGLAVTAPQDAEAQRRLAVKRIAYGELQIKGNDAVFVTDGRVVYIEGPDPRNPIQAENEPRVSVVPRASIFALNLLGADGWEVVPSGVSAKSDLFLMTRPY